MRMSKLYMPAVLAVGALALAGCGGGSGTTTTTTMTSSGERIVIKAGDKRTIDGYVYACAGDADCVVTDVDDLPDNVTRTPVKQPETVKDTSDSNAEVANKLRAANAALRTLSGDADDDNSALKKANDHHKDATNVIKAQGVSSAIAASAQGVLDARKELVDAVAKAKAERTAAMARVETLDDGATKDGLNGLITEADAVIKAGEALLNAKGGKSLQGLVAQYTGKGNTPAEKANKEAESLNAAALAIGDSGITNARRPLVRAGAEGISGATTRTALGTNSDNVFADGHNRTASMLKFSEIFEGQTKDIALNDEILAAVSLKGADGDDLVGTDITARTSPGAANGGTHDYLGITGTVHCRKADGCAEGGVSEGWYFVPDSQDDYFAPDGKGGYDQAKYVEWGMWLMENDENDLVVNRYVGLGTGSSALGTDSSAGNFNVATPATTENKLAATATYTGGAAGLSTRETGTGDDKKTASGHFTAKVSLTAKFQATPELTGTISGFEPEAGQGSDHVNPSWNLKLADGTEFADGTVDAGDYDSTSITGGWTAQAYGSGTTAAPKRPDGIFGGFNADFSDGKASGVYHAD